MSKPHIKLTLDLSTITIANNVKTWLESKLNIIGLDKNINWKEDGEILLLKPNELNNLEFPRIIFFSNLNHIDRQKEFKTLLINKIKEGALLGKVKYIRVEKWMCSHDEENPQHCIPNIIHERLF